VGPQSHLSLGGLRSLAKPHSWIKKKIRKVNGDHVEGDKKISVNADLAEKPPIQEDQKPKNQNALRVCEGREKKRRDHEKVITSIVGCYLIGTNIQQKEETKAFTLATQIPAQNGTVAKASRKRASEIRGLRVRSNRSTRTVRRVEDQSVNRIFPCPQWRPKETISGWIPYTS